MKAQRALKRVCKRAEAKVRSALDLDSIPADIYTSIALKEAEEEESHESLEEVYKELALHAEKIPAEALEGKWI